MSRPLPGRIRPELDGIGAVAKPAHGFIDCTVVKDLGSVRLDIALRKARIQVTDATTSGSYGTLKLFTFAEGAVSYLGCRQDYTAYKPDGTGVPADTAFKIGVGSAAIAAAADGALTGTSVDIGAAVDQTLSSGTTTGTAATHASTAIDGTTTPATINLNFSGTAATVDGDGWLEVTGTISVSVAQLGDD